MKHLTDEQLTQFLYAESCDEKEIQSHLNSCHSCQTKLDELMKLVTQLDQSNYKKPKIGMDIDKVYGIVGASVDDLNDRRQRIAMTAKSSSPWKTSRQKTSPWKSPLAFALVASLAVAAFFAGDFYRSSQTQKQIDSAITLRIQSELNEMKQSNDKSMAAIEHRLVEHINATSTYDPEFHNQLVILVRQLRKEQLRIGRELQLLATNTDNALQMTSAKTHRNTRVLVQLQDVTGVKFSP